MAPQAENEKQNETGDFMLVSGAALTLRPSCACGVAPVWDIQCPERPTNISGDRFTFTITSRGYVCPQCQQPWHVSVDAAKCGAITNVPK